MSAVKFIDFWASWCGPCKVMNPVIEELEKEYAGKITVEKINVDLPESQTAVAKYQVMAMPTYFLEKNGQVVEQFVGAQSKKSLVEAIERVLS